MRTHEWKPQGDCPTCFTSDPADISTGYITSTHKDDGKRSRNLHKQNAFCAKCGAIWTQWRDQSTGEVQFAAMVKEGDLFSEDAPEVDDEIP